MKLEWIEKIVDKAIPYVVILLGIEIVSSFIWDLHAYEHYLRYFDYFVITIFIIDLLFKWTRVRSMKVFVRLYWIDLLAVFPFYWAFAAYETVAGVTRMAEEGQKVVHEALLIREVRIAREIEAIRVAGESERFFIRMFRSGQRILRLIALQWEVAHGHIKRAHVYVHHAPSSKVKKPRP
ncbi:MAG: hypothetical protein QF486_03475 [Candidatus Woesearchaeota archaeon]|jgi:hypothetical protein|nr:hypothetical protein [Candidatus Woesearchaeota archaeon]MDP7182055.1 hypothetical protein [Candidatus Woesearchaeota archaeon]MDP7198657.1 hypothetical protein [Candidatus Woesearchaeota archaeon]MDP7467631.1 hypothetical protein [Candidatus Woesearchaeota archaeon]MDP7647151.1 hypothetical protein [Candidatus Woesearchaeota archaeon]|tara:strand:- start:130 stop:669 length:540 start_codon:yes stop_codon:yes gene_type:complete